MVRKLVFPAKLLIKQLIQSSYKPLSFSIQNEQIPYYSQWESRDLAPKILAEQIQAEDDPKWKQSGAKSKLEYRNWSWSACGMACFQMILKTITDKKIPIVVLGKQALKYGGYKLNQPAFDKGDYQNSLPGLFYKPFVVFAQKEYGLSSKVCSPMTLKDIVKELEDSNFVITSVNSNIRDPKSSSQSSGHLVLVTGYDWVKKQFYLHNPSGLPGESQIHTKISFEDFEKFFHYRGIIIKNPNRV